MAAGHVDRDQLSTNYQDVGDIYLDTKTEGAMEALAQQIDENYDANTTHKTAVVLDHPDGSVTTAKLADNAVTNVKMADNSVNTSELVDGAVTNPKIVPGTITSDRLVPGTLDSRYYTETELSSTVSGSSGAEIIGSAPITGVAGSTPYAQLSDLKNQINQSVVGQIPDGTLAPVKLSFDPGIDAKDAGGTGTVITVTVPSLAAYVDNRLLTFIAAANNGGAATTINVNALGAKSLYRSGTTSPPTLIAGKAYTVWYDATGGNFFTKASAEGTAVAGNVLAGQTFSSDIDTGLSGAMPNRAGDTVALASSVSGTTLKLRASDGFRDGVDDNVTITDANFVASKITAPNVLFGLTGTAAPRIFANGSGTMGATKLNFSTGAAAGTVAIFPCTVSGLTFQPTVILLVRSGSTNNNLNLSCIYNSYSPVTTTISPNTFITSYYTSSTGAVSSTIYVVDGTVAFVTSTGFQLPGIVGVSTAFDWYAFA